MNAPRTLVAHEPRAARCAHIPGNRSHDANPGPTMSPTAHHLGRAVSPVHSRVTTRKPAAGSLAIWPGGFQPSRLDSDAKRTTVCTMPWHACWPRSSRLSASNWASIRRLRLLSRHWSSSLKNKQDAPAARCWCDLAPSSLLGCPSSRTNTSPWTSSRS